MEAAKHVFGDAIATYDRTPLAGATRNGIPLLPVKHGSICVTLDLVKQLDEELR